MAVESAHPRPRSHVASSTPSSDRSTSREAASNISQAMMRSQAGSPTPRHPQSMTAASRPSRNKMLPGVDRPAGELVPIGQRDPTSEVAVWLRPSGGIDRM